MYALFLGFLAALFFSLTFILNSVMGSNGNSWLWSASLRFIFMLPMLIAFLALKGDLKASLTHFKQNSKAYTIWGTLGFGLFYAPLTFASTYAPGWFVAGNWQLTIVAGILLTPFIANNANFSWENFPWNNLKWSLLILAGIALTMIDQLSATSVKQVLLGIIPILLAAFMYPLGNRKMMVICGDAVNTTQRVLNMTIGSLPFWILISIAGYFQHGLPTPSQINLSLIVALFSGVIATVLFFSATRLVYQDPRKLAAIEATQSGEIILTLLGEMIILNIVMPPLSAVIGIAIIMVGIIFNSLSAAK